MDSSGPEARHLAASILGDRRRGNSLHLPGPPLPVFSPLVGAVPTVVRSGSPLRRLSEVGFPTFRKGESIIDHPLVLEHLIPVAQPQSQD